MSVPFERLVRSEQIPSIRAFTSPRPQPRGSGDVPLPRVVLTLLAGLAAWLLLALSLLPFAAEAQISEGGGAAATVVSVKPAINYATGYRVDCGTQLDLVVTLQNTGSQTWDGRVSLGATGDADPFRTDPAPRVALPRLVRPGETVDVTVPLTIPADVQMSGTSEWQLVAGDGSWFGDIASRKLFVVCQRDLTDDARVVSHTLPELMECGSTRRVGITMENTGTSFWSKDLAMRLGDPGNADPFGLVTRVHMPDTVEVAPGQSHTFEFDIRAPDAAGTYTTDWRMVHTWVRWFGEVAAQQINVTCDDYGVRFMQPRDQVLENGQVFDWGVLREGDSPAAFTFRVAAPDSFAGSMYNLRVVSEEGPVKVDFGALASELTGTSEIPAQQGLDVAGTLVVQKKMLQEVAPGGQVPFRVVIAFDHDLGGPFQFEVVGTAQKAACGDADTNNWDFQIEDYGGPFVETIPEDDLPSRLTFRGRVTNQDPSVCLSIPVSGFRADIVAAPPGISTAFDLPGASVIELQPGQSYTFSILIDATIFAENGEYSANIGVNPTNTSATTTFNISGTFEILRPELSLGNVTVRLASGAAGSHLDSLSFGAVGEDVAVDFEVENGNNADMRIEDLTATLVGPASTGLAYFPSPTSAVVPEFTSAPFGGQLRVLSTAVPGAFTIRIAFRVTDTAIPTTFDELFMIDIDGFLTACGGGGNCGPVAAVTDARGDVVFDTHRLQLSNVGTHDVEFFIANVGDQELVIQPPVTTLGSFHRYSVVEQPFPTQLPAGSDETSRFVVRFDGEGQGTGEVFGTTVTIPGVGTNMPYTFRLEVETVRPAPLDVEVVGFTIDNGEVNLGQHDQLPLLPVIRITNPTGSTYYINAVRSLRTSGGPLRWAWVTRVPEGSDPGDVLGITKNGGVLNLGGKIELSGQTGDVNRPYTFSFSFRYGRTGNTDDGTYRLTIRGDLIRVYNPDLDAPDIDCENVNAADVCATNYCGTVREIYAAHPLPAFLCVTGTTKALWVCTGCTGIGPCFAACAGAVLGTAGCIVAGGQFFEALEQALRDTKTCYCNRENRYCENTYFIGYEILNLPVGASVDVYSRCRTSGGLDFDERETVSLSNSLDFDLMSCPESSAYDVRTYPVQMPGGSTYKCTLADAPGSGDEPMIPQYSGSLTEAIVPRFDCRCTDPAGCGQLYTLLGTAENLPSGAAVTVVAHLEGDFPTQIAALVTVTENGQFQFPVPVPAADSYLLTIENKDDYPQCSVESTGNAIGGSGNVVDIANLSCDPTRPNVRILVPADGDTVQPTANGTIQVTAVAGDSSGVREVVFYEDGTSIGVSTSSTHLYDIAWVPNGSGSHTLQALAQSVTGATTFSDPVTVTVTGSVLCDGDSQAPVIQRVSPAANEAAPIELGNTLTLEAEVSDDIGMSHVDFFLDGNKVTVFNNGPLFLVNVPQVSLGQHTLRVVAVDVCGKERSVAQYSFTVVEGNASLATGALTVADCEILYGYAQDPDTSAAVVVELYRDGPRGAGGLIDQVVASESCTGLGGSGNCFTVQTPSELKTGQTEVVYAHARDLNAQGQATGEWSELQLSPRLLTCSGGGGGSAPTIPVGFSASNGTYTDRVQLGWTPANGANDYQVYRNTTNNSGAATMVAGNVTTTAYDDMSVQAGSTYYYWLKASNGNGTSDFSSMATGSTSATVVNDHQPAGHLDVADCTHIAGWARDADTTGPIQVHLYRGGPAGGGGTVLAHVVADDFRGDLPFPDKNHGFGWNVPTGSIPDGMPIYAYGINVDSGGNQDGDSSLLGGSPFSFDCPVDLGAPTGVAATDGTYPDKVRVTWNAVSGATSYNVWRAEVGSGAAVLLQLGVTGQVFDDTSAVPGLVYDYWVAAHNNTGTSDFSSADTGYISGPATNTYEPEGSLEIADCSRIVGWTRDGDFSGAIEAHIYRDAPAGQGGTVVGHALADIYRSDLPYADKSHGYDWQVPAGVTIPHGTPIYVYGIGVDSNGTETASSTLLFGSPMSYNCPANGPAVNNHQPEGTLDTATCTRITGWARDADNTAPIQVHLYKGAPAGSGGQVVATFLADLYRSDLSFADKEHGFDWPVPAGSIPAGTPIYAYGINIDSHGDLNGDNIELVLSPRPLSCP